MHKAFRELRHYKNSDYSPGRKTLVLLIWYYFSLLCMENGLFPISRAKVFLLRIFGAKIGAGVVIKPNVRIKFPWRLTVGDHCWIGQEVWIDNLANVTLESDVCISQGAYLCTGSHDHRSPTFELKVAPILVKHGAWIAAKAIILQGAVIEAGEVVSAGAVVGKRVSGK
ncbi:MAG: WcaF family extracellular polysaccharide biosynthesis acetyltransferase [Planctomyces sp.]